VGSVLRRFRVRGFRMGGQGLRVQRVLQGSGVRVQGLGFRV